MLYIIPQMSPMNWIILCSLFIFSYISLASKIYFFKL